jgi:outer membrane lipase/esterase
MTCRVRLISAAGLCACVVGVMGVATAAKAYDAEYVFGDSLSDNGNAAEAGGVPYPNPPSYHYAYTNGPVAVADLAHSLGLPALEPSLWFNGFTDQHNLFPAGFTPGTNYAFAGATANLVGYTGFPPANLPEQVSAYTTHVSNIADKSALYVIMIGGNDVINAISSGFTDAYLTTGVDSEIAQITTLAGDGARNFLIVNVPNVGLIPLLSGNSAAATLATEYSQFYDAALQTQLNELALPAGTALNEFNLYDYNEEILAHPLKYGFTNTTQACYSNTPSSDASATGCDASNIDSFVYWDDVHPTKPVQALWAQGMQQAIPEASSWAMLLMGFAGTAFMGLRSARKGARRRERPLSVSPSGPVGPRSPSRSKASPR